MTDPNAIDREGPAFAIVPGTKSRVYVQDADGNPAGDTTVREYHILDDDPAPHNGTHTSKAAAESLTPETLRGLRAKVYQLIAARSYPMAHAIAGTTSDDVERILDMRHQTASARVHELAKAGLIVPNGRRLTRSGRQAVAWVMAKGGGK